MLNDSERAELERYRGQEKFSRTFGLVLVGLMVIAVGSCSIAAYKADAFFGSLEGGINFGVDIAKMMHYYRSR